MAATIQYYIYIILFVLSVYRSYILAFLTSMLVPCSFVPCTTYSKENEKDATSASQALNAAWSVLRDAQSRANYNRGIIDKAIAEEAEEKRANAHSRHAAAQKRRVEEVATACAAKRAKTCQHQKGASGKTSTSSTSVPATSKPGSSSSAPAPASTQHFEFCKLLEHKGFATCKSTMQKQLQRKFEHKGYAGAAHALAVAKEFQIATEKLVTETLGQTKLEGLKKFCSDNEIEIPAVTRLTKAFLYEFIEEASQGAFYLSYLCCWKGWSTPLNFSIFCIG